jgi:hypothetical protein
MTVTAQFTAQSRAAERRQNQRVPVGQAEVAGERGDLLADAWPVNLQTDGNEFSQMLRLVILTGASSSQLLELNCSLT